MTEYPLAPTSPYIGGRVGMWVWGYSRRYIMSEGIKMDVEEVPVEEVPVEEVSVEVGIPCINVTFKVYVEE